VYSFHVQPLLGSQSVCRLKLLQSQKPLIQFQEQPPCTLQAA
jgi:hypothetical protein